jgi:hypothetical protein
MWSQEISPYMMDAYGTALLDLRLLAKKVEEE